MAEPIKTVEEFIAWTKELQGGLFLYRGLADADWEVESSAYRRIRKSEDFSIETLPAGTFQNYMDHLLDDASLQGFRERQDRSLSDLELLAELQHYGAATCLIDFTTNALIALWFACQEEEGKPGKVVAMATDDIRAFSTISYEDLKKPIKEFLNQGKLWKWEPSGQINRIVAQQSVFAIGEGRIEKSQYEEITITAAYKKVTIEALEKSFGIRGQQLFNDLAGFAQINAHDQPFNRFSAEDLLFLGDMFHQRGKYQQAIERYGRALEIDSDLAMAYYGRGTAKGTLKDHQGALADLDKAIERNPQNAEALNNRGNAKLALGDRQGAIADYDSAIILNPHFAGSYNRRGNARYSSGDYLGALADYDMAISLNPQDGATFYSRGLAKHALGDHLGAIVDCNMAISLNPYFAGSYTIRGNAKFALGDYQGAIADYDKVIEFYPQDSTAYYNRGNARRASGDPLRAIADYDNSTLLNPRFAEAYFNRGISKRTLGDEAGAIQDFGMASELNPDLRPP